MDDFKKVFLRHYLSTGLGSMPKRDIDALVLHLLDEYGLDGDPLRHKSNQEVSVILKTTASKIRSLRYEAALKFFDDADDLARWKLLEIFARSRLDTSDKRVQLIIEDQFVKNWIQGELKQRGLVFDNSFNTEIVKVPADDLKRLFSAIYDEKLAEEMAAKIDAGDKPYAHIKQSFIKGAASRLGSTSAAGMLNMLLSLASGN